MKFFIGSLIIALLLVSACKRTDCANSYSTVSYTSNPVRGAFVGNYHCVFTADYANGGGPQNYDMTITIPSNSYGNWININGQIYSTSDSTCTLNKSCQHMSSNSTTGLIRNDSIFITTYSPDALPPDFIWSTVIGVKF